MLVIPEQQMTATQLPMPNICLLRRRPRLDGYPLDPDKPHTNFSLGGTTRFSRGSAIQMAAGYEGLGKGAAAGGASIIFDIYASAIGDNSSSATAYDPVVPYAGLSADKRNYCNRILF